MRVDRLTPVLVAMLLAACGSTSKDGSTDDSGSDTTGPGGAPAGDEVAAAMVRLQGLDAPGTPDSWAASRAELDEARAIAAANGDDARLLAAHEQALARFRERADDAFLASLGEPGRPFFEAYPVELDAAAVVARCLDDVRRTLAERGPAGFEAFLGAHGGSLDAPTVATLGKDYGAAWLAERCGERAPTPVESVACVLALARFGIPSAPDGLALTVLLVPPRDVADGAFDFGAGLDTDGLPVRATEAQGLAENAGGNLFVVRPAGARAVLEGSKKRAVARRTVTFDYYLAGPAGAARGRYTSTASRTFDPPDPKAISEWLRAQERTPLRDLLAHATGDDASLRSMTLAEARAEINR